MTTPPRPTTPRTALGLAVARDMRGRRRYLEMSAAAAAERIGVSKVTLERMESGASPMSLDALVRLCELYGVTVVDVIARFESDGGTATPKAERA